MSTATIDTISNEKLKKAIADALGHLEKAIDALPFLLSLTSAERQHTNGKMRDGEPEALRAVLETVVQDPASFHALKLNPTTLAELLERRDLLAPLAERAAYLADDLTDTLLHLGEAVKAPALSAYHVAAALAPHDPAIAATLQPARQFYQAAGRAGARTRKANPNHSPA
jgi:hypothetical protein